MTSRAMFDDMLGHFGDLRDQLWEGGHADRSTCEAIANLAGMIAEVGGR